LALPLVMAVVGCAVPKTASKSVAPTEAQRVVIVSIDGLRPDVLLRANAPTVRALMKDGAFTFWAKTTEVSITLPSHVSMFTGVTPEHHGVWFNVEAEENDNSQYPSVPTLFELAKAKGYTTAMSVGKSKLKALARPGSVDFEAIPDDFRSAAGVAEHAARIIRQHQPQVMFVHFPDVDASGHGTGWGTPSQVEAVERCDKALGVVVDALREKQLLAGTVIILSADHGGASTWHGRDDARSRHIPWIISGPGIKKNQDLTSYYSLTVNTEDTFATACQVMKIPLPAGVSGKAIVQALEHPPLEDVELLTDLKEVPATPSHPTTETPLAAGPAPLHDTTTAGEAEPSVLELPRRK